MKNRVISVLIIILSCKTMKKRELSCKTAFSFSLTLPSDDLFKQFSNLFFCRPGAYFFIPTASWHHIPPASTVWWLNLQQWSTGLPTCFTTRFLLHNESKHREHPITECLKAPRVLGSSYISVLIYLFLLPVKSSSCLWRSLLQTENSCKVYRRGAEGEHLGRWCSVPGLIDWLRDPGVMQAEGP